MNPIAGGHNMAVLGKTQSGKTAFARQLHARTPRTVSVWVNESGRNRVPDVASQGQPVRSVSGLKSRLNAAWTDGEPQRVNMVLSDRNGSLPRLRDLLWDVADRTGRELDMQVIVDEVDRVAPQSQKEYGNLPPRDAVRDFTSEGVKRGVKFVGVTQDPTTMDKKALRQSEWRMVFPMSAEQRDAVRKYGFNWDRVDSAPRYAGVMHNADGSVYDVYKAAEKFA
jgi:hypothetical protein